MHRERVLKALAGLLVGVEKKLHLADRRRRREDKLIERARLLEMQRADRKSTRLNSSHPPESRMPSSA